MKKILLIMMALALPVMAQKRVWSVAVEPLPILLGDGIGGTFVPEPQSKAVISTIADSAGNALVLLRYKFVSDGDNWPQDYRPWLLLWIDRKGVVVDRQSFADEDYYWPRNVQPVMLKYVSDQKCIWQGLYGTPLAFYQGPGVAGNCFGYGVRGNNGVNYRLIYEEMAGQTISMPDVTRPTVPCYFTAVYDATIKRIKLAQWRMW
jgi:hypothetical protein